MDIEARVDSAHREVLSGLPVDLLDLTDIAATRVMLSEFMASKPLPDMPVDVEINDHSADGFDGHRVLVRTYRPRQRRESSPALYWIHGGGMVLGDVSMNDFSCAEIASELDVVVVSVEYRLAPEFPFPVPLEDCYSGLSWLFDSAGELGVNTDRIAIGGASAGGGLAAGLALLARDRKHKGPCFQLLVYPMIDDRNETPSSHAITDPRVWNRAANLAGWNAYLDGNAGADDVPVYAAPARAADLSGLPPAMITVGELDLFLDEDIEYGRALLRAGVPTELHVYPGAFHGSNTFAPDTDVSKRWRRDELEALDRALNQ